MSISKRIIDNNFQKTEELASDFQRTREKKTDFLRKFKYENPDNNFVLHLEAQSKDDPDMLYRMEEYHSMIRRKYKLPVVQLVLYLGKGISKMHNFYSFRKNSFHYDIINIQEFSYKNFINTDKPEELILTILSDFEDKSKEQIAELIFSRAKSIINETNQMGKFVNQIEILSKLRNLDDFIQRYILNTMALDLKIEDTFTFKRGKMEGKIEGEKRGEKRGEKKKRDKMILSLYQKGKLSVEDIADAAEVSVEYVLKLVKKSS
jgi:predicted transposase/invertase (TIGR01784 family)